jgi:hypothetical protein
MALDSHKANCNTHTAKHPPHTAGTTTASHGTDSAESVLSMAPHTVYVPDEWLAKGTQDDSATCLMKSRRLTVMT